ncbi:PREDICTED: ES1 protein homolog, mitochondrial isoform X1 [Hipposideros armiger]|uniref:ES1 protein homolog, mitochondrial isoform X1 n=1 Tax=Hipposideros armiger TaxID=186990 RepID=A0A8B7PVV7_HIPAR|nr:PREDICTED: ES1 protein homolog, mitochondrial isoform X1 [Hipposideros armiger]
MAAVRALVAPRLAAASTFAPLPGRRPLLPHKPAASPRAALHGSAPRPGAKVALVLSGCGVYDGTELHEASAALVHLSRGGAEVQIFAPDVPQMHVIDHTKGQPSESESRNVLTESARIARGKITNLAQLSAANHDAAIFPGGFGAAKNLSTFAVDGKDCKVNKDVERVLKEFHKAGKPIGLIEILQPDPVLRGSHCSGQKAQGSPTGRPTEHVSLMVGVLSVPSLSLGSGRCPGSLPGVKSRACPSLHKDPTLCRELYTNQPAAAVTRVTQRQNSNMNPSQGPSFFIF